MTGTSDGLDTRDMIVVHDALRHTFSRAPGLVRGVADGDHTRAGVVADHLTLATTLLHHHQGEDRLVWPVLLPRVGPEHAATVQRMEAQHEGIHEVLDEVHVLLDRWRGSARAEDREPLAAALDELDARLGEHLAAEETTLLPLASRHLSQAEWDTLGQEGMAGVPQRQLPLVLGMLMYRADPAVIAQMLTHVPLLPRLLLPHVAPRIRTRYFRRVYGTATP